MPLPKYLHATATLLTMLALPPATAAPVQIRYEGHVADYSAWGGAVDGVLPLGSTVRLSATFEHTFAAGTYPFDTNLGPASGTLTLAGVEHPLSAVSVYAMAWAYDAPHPLHWVQLRFDSEGPELAGTDYWAFTLVLAPDLSAAWGGRAGFLFDSGWYSYAHFETDRFELTRLNAVPTPATLPLMLAALAGVALIRRKAAAATVLRPGRT